MRPRITLTEAKSVGHMCACSRLLTVVCAQAGLVVGWDESKLVCLYSLTELRWSTHGDCAVTKQALDLLLRLRPEAGVLENVMGLSHCQTNHDLSPLKAIQQTLEQGEYYAECAEVCASVFMNVTRRRLATCPLS